MEPDEFDMQAEEHLFPTVDEPETWDEGADYSEPLGSFDLSDDADALASAGMGTDEDYGGEDDFLDGSYEE